MNCPNCDNPTRPGVAFCGECGFKLLVPVMTAFPPPPPPAVPTAVLNAPPVGVPSEHQSVVEAPPGDANPFIISAPPPGVLAPPPPPPVAESSSDIEATRVSTRRRSAPSWSLVMSDGQRHTLNTSALLGRDAAVDSRWPEAAVIAVIDSTKTVSKTHALFEVDATGLWVTDLHSSNGVFIEHPDGSEFDVEPGARTAVQSGATVLLGDFAVTVEKG